MDGLVIVLRLIPPRLEATILARLYYVPDELKVYLRLFKAYY